MNVPHVLNALQLIFFCNVRVASIQCAFDRRKTNVAKKDFEFETTLIEHRQKRHGISEMRI